MMPYNVIIFDVNSRKVISYDIMKTLLSEYKDSKNRPQTRKELKQFILNTARYYWWARCEWEIQVTGFPIDEPVYKLDVYYQVEMNIEVITDVLIKNIQDGKFRERN